MAKHVEILSLSDGNILVVRCRQWHL